MFVGESLGVVLSEAQRGYIPPMPRRLHGDDNLGERH